VGLSYTAAAGYYGADTMRVRAYDGMLADTTLIYITVYPDNAGAISGADTVCVGHSISLSGSVPGGSWASGSGNATVSAAGLVNGVAVGMATISYTISNPCTTASAVHNVYVRVAGEGCATAVAAVSGAEGFIYPNPNKGSFSIRLPWAARVRISDADGRLVKELTIGANKTSALELNVAAGIYLLSAQSAEGVWHEKIVVE